MHEQILKEEYDNIKQNNKEKSRERKLTVGNLSTIVEAASQYKEVESNCILPQEKTKIQKQFPLCNIYKAKRCHSPTITHIHDIYYKSKKVNKNEDIIKIKVFHHKSLADLRSYRIRLQQCCKNISEFSCRINMLTNSIHSYPNLQLNVNIVNIIGKV